MSQQVTFEILSFCLISVFTNMYTHTIHTHTNTFSLSLHTHTQRKGTDRAKHTNWSEVWSKNQSQFCSNKFSFSWKPFGYIVTLKSTLPRSTYCPLILTQQEISFKFKITNNCESHFKCLQQTVHLIPCQNCNTYKKCLYRTDCSKLSYGAS